MAKAKSRDPSPPPEAPASKTPDPRWRRLTWDDLDGWAGGGSVSRGKTYHRQGRVKELAISADHRLLATVIGTRRYTVSIRLQDTGESGRDVPLESSCTCPVGADGCKHAVAVVAAYLERLNDGERVPLADADDPRWAKLENDGAEIDDDDAYEEGEDDPDDEPVGRRSKDTCRHRDEKVESHIRAKSREELAELICSLIERYPDLKEEFRDRVALGEGYADRLIAQARQELRRVTSEEAWRDNWAGEGNTPDYGMLRHRLERLTEMGHADAVARLGRELVERGIEQLGRSHDEGETATELHQCLPVVFDAVVKSSLTPVRKLLFAIDAYLQDDFDIVGDAADVVLNEKYSQKDWSTVADELACRLSNATSKRRAPDDDEDEGEGEGADPDGDFSRDYHRDQISNWLARALDHAGRGDELPAIYEREAKATGSYERLVRFLMEQGRDDDARRWAAEGIAKTANKLPGIASNLAGQLCELARRHKQWGVVAAHAAHLFFGRPGRDRFNELMTAADKAGCRESVRGIALRCLETGVPPIRLVASKKNERRVETDPDWPLPVPEYLAPLLTSDDRRRAPAGPHFDVLIDMAIADKRPDEALHWYDQWDQWRARSKESLHGYSWSRPGVYADRVAEAVASSHPRRALEIYRGQMDRHLPQASVSAYETVAASLRKMRPILKCLDRETEWAALVQQIRERYHNRPRLMEILDRLESRPIVSGRRGCE